MGWWSVGITLVCPGLASAQSMPRADLLGSWRGATEYTYSPDKRLHVSRAFEERHATTWLTLWADGLWWFQDEDDSEKFFTHGGGRWRLNGDTLWLGDDGRYSRRGLFLRLEAPQMDSVDTLHMDAFPGDFPKNDSLFWRERPPGRDPGGNKIGEQYVQEETDRGRMNYYWWLAVYKVSKDNGKLTLVRLDSLSNSTWLPAKWVLEYQGKNARDPYHAARAHEHEADGQAESP